MKGSSWIIIDYHGSSNAGDVGIIVIQSSTAFGASSRREKLLNCHLVSWISVAMRIVQELHSHGISPLLQVVANSHFICLNFCNSPGSALPIRYS